MLISSICPRARAAAPSPTWTYSSEHSLRYVRRLPALISSMRNEVTLLLAQRQHQACLSLQSQVNQFTWPRSSYIYGKSLTVPNTIMTVANHIPRRYTRELITHPSTNRTRRRVTSLMRPTSLPLRHAPPVLPLTHLYWTVQGFCRRFSTAPPSTRRVKCSRNRATARAPVCCTTTTHSASGCTRFRWSGSSWRRGCTAWRCSSASVETVSTGPRRWRRPRCRQPSSLPAPKSRTV